jgi:transcriptional regulator with XRE-family HTH domain
VINIILVVIMRTMDEWEVDVGTRVRELRMLAGVTQADLAKRANVAIGAVASLERGRGSTLKTFIAVTRALDRTTWLDQISPAVAISPIQMMRDQGRRQPRQRVYRRRSHPDQAEQDV